MDSNKQHKNPNVPTLRFPGFTDEWKKMGLSELLDFYSTNSLSWDQLDYDGEGIKNLHYGLIHVGLPTLVDATKESLPYIKPDFTPRNYEVVKEGDVAFADASEDTNEVAKAVELINLSEEPIVFGLHTIHARDNRNLTVSGFKGFYFSSDAFHKQVRRLAQGTKIFSVSPKILNECNVSIPSKAEQEKINKLLSLIDERIATQNKIIERLESLIGGIVENLYTPKSGWKEYKYSELLTVINNRNKQFKYKNILAASQKQGMVERDSLNLEVQFDQNSIGTYKIVNRGDYVLHLRSFQGGLAFCERDGICSPAYSILRPTDKLTYGYFEHFFTSQRFIDSLKLVTYGIRDGRSINVEEFLNMTVSVPPEEDQIKTITILRVLKHKSLLERNILAQYETQRRFLLNALFI